MDVLQRKKLSSDIMDHGSRMVFQPTVNFEERSLTSVKITEYPDSGQANPDPLSDNSDEALEDFLSPQSLRTITGKSNLSEVTLLEMQVDTSETSIGNIGESCKLMKSLTTSLQHSILAGATGQLLPNLKQLKLSNSVITSVRDLGTSLNDLTTLWLSRCHLVDLDGISCFYSLKELYLAYNEVDDLSSLSMLDSLCVLDLEGNNVDDITQVEFLALCTELVSLTLAGNPVEHSPHSDTKEKDLKFYDYRSAVSKAVPQLRILDDEPFLFDIINGKPVIRSTSINKKNNGNDFKEDMLLVQDCLKALPAIDEDESDDQDSVPSSIRPGSGTRSDRKRPASGRNRPTSCRNRPVSGRNRPVSGRMRPGSSLNRPSASLGLDDVPMKTPERPDTVQQKNPESSRQGRANASESQSSLDDDEISDLTHGSRQVLCGNPVRALLARRKELKGNIRLKFDRNFAEPKTDKFIPEHSYHDDEEEQIDRNEIFEELKKWREDFEKSSNDLAANEKKDKREASHVDSGRASLSPTPPSGNPARSRPSRRRPTKTVSNEPPRPQTASDFRHSLSSSDFMMKSKMSNVVSKSMDFDGALGADLGSSSEDSATSSQASDYKITDDTPTMRKCDVTSQSHSSVRPRQFRPGTAAAALKRTSKKPFT